jgi:Spy/CpxP family protein refolding chaperone
MTTKPRFKILFATVVAVLLLLPTFADAADQNKGNRKNWYEQESVQQKLELTEDQVARIAEVEESFMPRLTEMNVEKRTAYRSLMSVLDSGEITQDKFEANRARLEAAYGAHAALTAERWRALRSVLTEQQWRGLPEAAPKALALGHFSVAKRGAIYMGPNRPKTAPDPK